MPPINYRRPRVCYLSILPSELKKKKRKSLKLLAFEGERERYSAVIDRCYDFAAAAAPGFEIARESCSSSCCLFIVPPLGLNGGG